MVQGINDMDLEVLAQCMTQKHCLAPLRLFINQPGSDIFFFFDAQTIILWDRFSKILIGTNKY